MYLVIFNKKLLGIISYLSIFF